MQEIVLDKIKDAEFDWRGMANGKHYICIKCNSLSSVIHAGDRYCSNCGVKIIWK